MNEEFEKWAGANGLCLERDFEAPENYVDGMTQEAELAWNAAWQASRKQAEWFACDDVLPTAARVLNDPLFVNGKEVRPLYISIPVIATRLGEVTMTCLEWFDDRKVVNGYTHWMPLPQPPQ